MTHYHFKKSAKNKSEKKNNKSEWKKTRSAPSSQLSLIVAFLSFLLSCSCNANSRPHTTLLIDGRYILLSSIQFIGISPNFSKHSGAIFPFKYVLYDQAFPCDTTARSTLQGSLALYQRCESSVVFCTTLRTKLHRMSTCRIFLLLAVTRLKTHRKTGRHTPENSFLMPQNLFLMSQN